MRLLFFFPPSLRSAILPISDLIFLNPRLPVSSSPPILFRRKFIEMGFWVTTLIFVLIGVVAALTTRLCCSRGPSTNLLHLTLIITATVCCWMMWAIVYLAQLNPLIVPVLNEGQ